ncbi:MAG: lysophospholipid acyltransferase family protein [Planctomycetota bacterium]|nr:lysophospholipid acyltransferase family protein [Planctomycetota bacterium]MDA1113434.1 lysophospholipid acyltransferase family protein [Planctomycetota bacterium]
MSHSNPRRRRWTRRFANRLAILFGPVLFRLLASSWRVTVVNQELLNQHHAGESAPVFAFWHQQIPAAIGSHRGYPVRVMVSKNRDGQMIADLAQRLGYKTIRGSSSRGALRALREMLKVAKGSEAIGFTPDGPRGPLHSVAPGVVYVAAISGRVLITVGFAASSAWRAKSWDRMLVPKPFARLVIAYDASLGVLNPAASREGAEQVEALKGVKESLDLAEAKAKEALRNL